MKNLSDRVRTPFQNSPFTDFSQEKNIKAQLTAIKKVSGELGQTYPLLIGKKRITRKETFSSVNPANPYEVIGYFAKASSMDVEVAITEAAGAFLVWKKTSAIERSGYLLAAADLLSERRFYFNAWLMYEAGKTWVEADADTAEAIDFLEFYAREIVRLDDSYALTPVAGEKNIISYIPLGVGVVIPPWNFPVAIMIGSTSASIGVGNAVVLKPASTAPMVAWQFIRILEEVGLPAGVVNFLTGSGASIGDVLVDHAQTRFVAFTGSRDVGLRIHERAAKHQQGQIWLKRTILEMGGKDAIIVDSDADLDAAAAGIVASAFGFSGQKCSSGSRAIVLADVYDAVVAKVVENVKALRVGDPKDRETSVGPVIDAAARKKILDYIAIGEKEGRLLIGGGDFGPGYFVQPTVFADVKPRARIAQEEIFGPVLVIIKAKDFVQALQIANDTEYGLTGAVYSRNAVHIAKAKEDFHVGNLYFNRKCTGAMVGGHPFGGFNMSGTDSKAGGRDYLLLFTQAKVISEKINQNPSK